jgi:hypothetical protein
MRKAELFVLSIRSKRYGNQGAITMKLLPSIAIVIATLTMTTVYAAAANSHDGDWVFDASNSFWSDGKMPKGMKATITLKFGPNKLIYHGLNNTVPDKPYITDHVTSLDGTPSKFENQERFNQVTVLQTGPDDMQILKMWDGDVIAGEFWTFSKDGKTAIRRGVAKAADGKSKAYQEAWIHR